MGGAVVANAPLPEASSPGKWSRVLPTLGLVIGVVLLGMSLMGVLGLLVFMFGQSGPYLMPMTAVDVMMYLSSSNIIVYVPLLALGVVIGVAGLWSRTHRRLAVIGLALAFASVLVTIPVFWVGLALV